jgi:phosphatidylserine/phosphatidylglycerophosphate/cardiolipin synthase-like enzyme
MRIRKPLYLFLALFLCVNFIGCARLQEKPQEVYFSPNGHVRERIIKAIDASCSTIDLAIFDFTSQNIKIALENAKKRGVKIHIIADSRQYKGSHSVIQSLIDSGFEVKISRGKNRGIMHNKFAIFDKTLLFTGSYNWTENAEYFNYENAIFITEIDTINQYQKEFDKIWNLNTSGSK